jgi:hypothetical protein
MRFAAIANHLSAAPQEARARIAPAAPLSLHQCVRLDRVCNRSKLHADGELAMTTTVSGAVAEDSMSTMEHDGILSPEDEVLFDTSNRRLVKKFDRATLLFIAILIGISMLAGFFGGLPVALANRCVMVETVAD